jgi:hypothetical protein
MVYGVEETPVETPVVNRVVTSVGSQEVTDAD